MGIKIKKLSEVIHDTGMKALIYGGAGTGKTLLCATANASTLIISAESGLLTLAESKESLISKNHRDFAPEFCQIAEIQTLEDIEELYQMLSNEKMCDWIMFDSISDVAERILAYEQDKSPDPRKIYPVLVKKVLNILKNFRDLTRMGYNVVFVAKQEKIKDEISGITSYVPMMPGGKLSNQIPYIFDHVLAMRQGLDDNGNTTYYMQTVACAQYEAKNRGGFLNKHEPPSLKHIYNKTKIKTAKTTENNTKNKTEK